MKQKIKGKIALSFASPEKEFFIYLWCDYFTKKEKKLHTSLLWSATKKNKVQSVAWARNQSKLRTGSLPHRPHSQEECIIQLHPPLSHVNPNTAWIKWEN
jgi:hypothetical protein